MAERERHESLTEAVIKLEKSHVRISSDMRHITEMQDKLVTSQEKMSSSIESLVDAVKEMTFNQQQTSKSFDRVHSRIDEEVIQGKFRLKSEIEKMNIMFSDIKDDVVELKKSRTWLVQLVIGKIVIVAIGALFYFGKG